jgi:hypothetical protein
MPSLLQLGTFLFTNNTRFITIILNYYNFHDDTSFIVIRFSLTSLFDNRALS